MFVKLGKGECGRERSEECRATTKDCSVVQSTEGMKDSAGGLKRSAKRMDKVQVDRREIKRHRVIEREKKEGMLGQEWRTNER